MYIYIYIYIYNTKLAVTSLPFLLAESCIFAFVELLSWLELIP